MRVSKTDASKRKQSPQPSEPNSKQRKVEESATTDQPQFLSAVTAFIIQAGIQKMRMQIFENQLKKYGGSLSKDFNNSVTHLVVDDKMEPDRMCRLLHVDKPPDNVTIIKSNWLSQCFKERKMVDIDQYLLDVSKSYTNADCKEYSNSNEVSKEVQPGTSGENKPEFPKVGFMFGHKAKTKTAEGSGEDSDYCPSDGEKGDLDADDEAETANSDVTSTTSPQKNLPRGNWVCAQSSKTQQENHNKHITDKLEEMVRTYESTNDKWRAFGYQKAIQALKKQPKAIATFEEAMTLPGVGKRLAEKIWEIAESGELRKLNEFKSSDEIKVIAMFKEVWGAGPHTARTWYQQGFRTLDDLKTKANLTHQQKVGLKLYDDILDRMPWEEAGEIEQVVREAAESIQDGVISQGCGSFRRRKQTCGDVDVLVTHPDGKSHKGLFPKLLAKLKQQGFLTDDLVTAEDDDNQKKYLGVCKLPGEGRRHRRLDIIVVPYDEYACALVYFTGSAHFNRSLRHLAKKMGMSLSEHSLNVGVVRNGSEKIFEGTPVPTPTEESVFVKMGVPYRPPEERDH